MYSNLNIQAPIALNDMLQTEDQMCQCPICERNMQLSNFMPIDCKTGKKIDHNKVFSCKECTYGMVIPRPEIEDIAKYYDIPDYYTQSKSHFEEEEKEIIFWDKLRLHLAWRFDQVTGTIESLVNQILNNKTANICELGCGGGNLLEALTLAAYKTYGVEVDLKANVFRKGLNVYQGTAENIPKELKSCKFDIVIMSHVLEHCLNPLYALENVYDLLSPGGRFICEVPNHNSLGFEYAGVTWEMLDIPRHLNFFTPESLSLMCRKMGFEILDITFLGYCRQFNNSWIDTEAKIYQKIIETNVEPIPFPIKNSRFRAWTLLLNSLLARPEKKYDSVRIVAVKS